MIFRTRPMTAHQIATKYALDRNINLHEWFGTVRTKAVSHPRQDCMRLIYEQTKLSMPQIGRIFNRDASTVNHSIRASQGRAR